jgi:glycosyltransferase involved in cell wall biosynthesis
MTRARQPLSAVLVTLDCARQLEAGLASLAFCDEVVIVDSGSTDGTVELALARGARVVNHDWLGFGAQKQFAVEQARHDWVLCVDSDECVTPELRREIEGELAAPRLHAYEFPRRNRFMGRYLKHGEGYPDWSLRLFDRRHARWSDDAVHERVTADGPVGRLKGDLLHDSAETLEKYIEKQKRYTTLAAEELRGAAAGSACGGNAIRMLLSPLVRFVKFYFVRLGFLDGWPGLVHILIGCRNSYEKYAKLRRLGKQR